MEIKMNVAVILSAGSGSRFGSDVPKQFINLAGKNIIEYTLEAFELNSSIDEICIVADESYHKKLYELSQKNGYGKVKKIIQGGSERKDSSFSAIKEYENQKDINLIFHDAVRPFVSQRIINDTIKALDAFDAVDVAIPTADTIIKVDLSNTIESIPKRSCLRRGQTPQAFKLECIKKAHLLAQNDANEVPFTDDCGLVKYYLNADVFVVSGEEKNIKITYPEDLLFAEKLIQINSRDLHHEAEFSNLLGKNYMIFGGNSGIGKEIASICKENGANADIYSRSNGYDIRDFENIKKAFVKSSQHYKQIDGVIVCSAVLYKNKLCDMSYEEIVEQINTNYQASVLIAKEAHSHLKNSHGNLTLFASSSYTKGRANYALYSSSKAAIVNLTQALSEEWQEDNIRVNVINPSRTKTPMRVDNFGVEPEETLLNAKKVALKTLQVALGEFSGLVVDIKKSVDE